MEENKISVQLVIFILIGVFIIGAMFGVYMGFAPKEKARIDAENKDHLLRNFIMHCLSVKGELIAENNGSLGCMILTVGHMSVGFSEYENKKQMMETRKWLCRNEVTLAINRAFVICFDDPEEWEILNVTEVENNE